MKNINILNFEGFVNEYHSVPETSFKAVKYGQVIKHRALPAKLKTIQQEAERLNLLPLAHELGQKLEQFHVNEIDVNSLDKVWYFLKNKYSKEIESSELNDIIQKLDVPPLRKVKDYLMNKYHKDVNFDFEGDTESPYLYHYTTFASFQSIFTKDMFIANAGECYECDTTGYIRKKMCTGCGGTGRLTQGKTYVCFSTDPDLYRKGFLFDMHKDAAQRTHHNCGIRIKLDFQKMKADGYQYKLGNEWDGAKYGENEIRITGTVNNVSKYLVSVEVYPTKLAKYPEDAQEAITFMKQHSIPYRLKA